MASTTRLSFIPGTAVEVDSNYYHLTMDGVVATQGIANGEIMKKEKETTKLYLPFDNQDVGNMVCEVFGCLNDIDFGRRCSRCMGYEWTTEPIEFNTPASVGRWEYIANPKVRI